MEYIRRYCILAVLFPFALWAQGTYYNSIDTGATSFVTDLHNLIYPHTRITYANFISTNIDNFASRDTTGGQKVVTCVYSGENYVYTPPFAWTTYSREHTWCQSWMPTVDTSGFTSRPEYSDQHHLYPVNQNNANGRRSNHPLGDVVTVTYQYLEGKVGLNSTGETVYEPRASHKGDAARALLYMAVCYNGYGGHDWTFNNLNNTILPGLSEAPEDVDMLIQWSEDDPPDDWEKARNEYVYSIQGNRNPFIDHPEYIDKIDFNTLTKKTSSTSPAITVSGSLSHFGTVSVGSSSSVQSYTVSGSNLTSDIMVTPPTGFEISTSDSPFSSSNPIMLSHSGGTVAATTVYVRFSPQSEGDYAGTITQTSTDASTKTIGVSGTTTNLNARGIFFSEYFEGASYDKAIEIFNGINTGMSVALERLRIRLYANGSSTPTTTSQLGVADDGSTNSIPFDSTFVVYHESFTSPDTNMPNADSTQRVAWTAPANFNGDDALELQYDTTGSGTWKTMDVFGQIGTDPGSAWGSGNTTTVNNGLIRKASINVGRSNGAFTPSDYFDGRSASADYSLPVTTLGEHTCTDPLPVELTSFTASVKGSTVLLQWQTATEVNNLGFEVQRCAAVNRSLGGNGSLEWTKIGFVDGNGTSNAPHSYSFVDVGVQRSVSYRLKQIDRDGKFAYSSEAEIQFNNESMNFDLSQNYPNPFNPVTEIKYQISQVGRVTLKIYDVLGREVTTLVNEIKDAGLYTVKFDASAISSGLYFYTMRSNGFSATKKLLLMR